MKIVHEPRDKERDKREAEMRKLARRLRLIDLEIELLSKRRMGDKHEQK